MREQLKPIFDAAADEVERLRRKSSEPLENTREQRKVIKRSATEQARQLLSGLSTTDLINFAAFYYAESHSVNRDLVRYKKLFLDTAKDKRSTLERVLKREERFNASLKQKRSKGAIARHAEHRVMKAEVFIWLDTNRPNFKSMDAAAEAITKEQPIAFRTARAWVGEWKKLRSAGTP